jgi:hypothetical protein
LGLNLGLLALALGAIHGAGSQVVGVLVDLHCTTLGRCPVRPEIRCICVPFDAIWP